MDSPLSVRVADALDQVEAQEWNKLSGTSNPFIRHEFLAGLERTGCLGDAFGWWPRHLLVHEGARLVGAAPLYLKDNSYGEFVFDWSWADAYRRHGEPYYPKLVSAIPYTPVTGPRLLVDSGADTTAVSDALMSAALALADREGASSLHWLFPDAAATKKLSAHGLMRRVGLQYHWSNPGYRDFQDYLDALTSKRRKAIRRERRLAAQEGVEIELLDGHQATAAHWRQYHDFYRSTFDRKWGVATLSSEFFQHVGQTLPDNVLLVMVRRAGRYVAGAFNLVGTDTLYGRHWGTTESLPYVHFEVCYYQTIEYCIARGLRRFEAGAQGEHKIARGFLPELTYSAHWIRHPGFRTAIGRFLAQEAEEMEAVRADLAAHSPYRNPN